MPDDPCDCIRLEDPDSEHCGICHRDYSLSWWGDFCPYCDEFQIDPDIQDHGPC